jgi:hypothetical protein
MTAYAEDERAGLQIVAVVSVSLLLPTLNSCEWTTSDAAALCQKTLAHRQALSNERDPAPIGLLELRGCAKSLTNAQADCAQNANTLDDYERCFF